MTPDGPTPLLAHISKTIYRQRYYVTGDVDEKIIAGLAEALGFDGQFKTEFEANVLCLTADIKTRQILSKLPEAPVRDYERGLETVIDYVKSPEGLKPWLDAGVLTRVLVRELSPKAERALIYYLEHNELPADVPIPTRADVIGDQLSILVKSGVDLRAIYKYASKMSSRLERLGIK